MLTVDINTDPADITPDILAKLKALGWQWDAGEQVWRLHNETGNFSPNPADHVRALTVDLAAIENDLATTEQLTHDNKGDQMKSTSVSDPQHPNHGAGGEPPEPHQT